MTFCVTCGEKLPRRAEYCPKCGHQITTKTTAATSGASTTTRTMEKKDYSDIGSVLILLGGILSILFSLFSILGFAFMFIWSGIMHSWMGRSTMWSQWGVPMAFGGWLMGFILVGSIISIIMGIIAIMAFRKIRSGEIKYGGTIALIIGVIMLVTMNWLGALITLVGGILCYTSQ
jgi:hypothetical protein